MTARHRATPEGEPEMTDNTQPVEGSHDPDTGRPFTRGEIVEMIAVDLRAIRDGAGHAVSAWEADGDSSPVVTAALALAGHLQAYTVPLNAMLAAHDKRQALIDAAMRAFTVPDTAEELS